MPGVGRGFNRGSTSCADMEIAQAGEEACPQVAPAPAAAVTRRVLSLPC